MNPTLARSNDRAAADRTTSHRGRLLLIVGLLLGVVGSISKADVDSDLDWKDCLRTLRYWYDETEETPAFRADVDSAVATWNAAATGWTLVKGTETECEIQFLEGATAFANGAAGACVFTTDDAGAITGVDIVIDQAGTAGPRERVLLHEIGHALRLEHVHDADTKIELEFPTFGEYEIDFDMVDAWGGESDATTRARLDPYVIPRGDGYAGCTGPQQMGVDQTPRIDTPSFGIHCDHAPASSLGLLLVGTVVDEIGSDPFGLGVLLHVDLLASTEVLALDIVSDPWGFGVADASIPNDVALVGKTYVLQCLWSWGGTCALPPYGLSTSNALELLIQP